MSGQRAATCSCREKRRRRRERRAYECPEIAAFVSRQLRGLVRRAGEGDLEAISALKQLRGEVRTATRDAARALNDPAGPAYSWEQIAREFGTSKQNVIKQFAAKGER